MDATAVLVSCGGLLVAAFSVWLSYKNRGATHRDKLYERQMDGYVVVLKALNELYGGCQRFVVENGFRLDDAGRVKFRLAMSRGELAPAYRKLAQVHQDWILFLPPELGEAITKFNRVLMALSAEPQVSKQYPDGLVYSSDPGWDISVAYQEVVRAARRAIGVEPLSAEILRVVGERSPSDRGA